MPRRFRRPDHNRDPALRQGLHSGRSRAPQMFDDQGGLSRLSTVFKGPDSAQDYASHTISANRLVTRPLSTRLRRHRRCWPVGHDAPDADPRINTRSANKFRLRTCIHDIGRSGGSHGYRVGPNIARRTSIGVGFVFVRSRGLRDVWAIPRPVARHWSDNATISGDSTDTGTGSHDRQPDSGATAFHEPSSVAGRFLLGIVATRPR